MLTSSSYLNPSWVLHRLWYVLSLHIHSLQLHSFCPLFFLSCKLNLILSPHPLLYSFHVTSCHTLSDRLWMSVLRSDPYLALIWRAMDSHKEWLVTRMLSWVADLFQSTALFLRRILGTEWRLWHVYFILSGLGSLTLFARLFAASSKSPGQSHLLVSIKYKFLCHKLVCTASLKQGIFCKIIANSLNCIPLEGLFCFLQLVKHLIVRDKFPVS